MLHLCPALLFFQREELLIEGYVQPAVEVIAKQAPELGSDTGQTTFVDVNHCGMSVRVGIYTGFGMDDGDIPEDVVIRAEPLRSRAGGDEGVFVIGKWFCLIGFLLEDNQVTAYFGTCTVCKEVVGQTNGGYQMGMLHELVADAFIRRGVQNALRGDKSQYTPSRMLSSPFRKNSCAGSWRRADGQGSCFL